MNTEYTFTPRTLQQYMHSTISPITTIKKPTQKQWRPPRHNATNSRPSATPTGVVNLAVKSNKAILLNCLKFALYLVF